MRKDEFAGRLFKCGKCGVVRYCSKDHQIQDHKQHRCLCPLIQGWSGAGATCPVLREQMRSYLDSRLDDQVERRCEKQLVEGEEELFEEEELGSASKNKRRKLFDQVWISDCDLFDQKEWQTYSGVYHCSTRAYPFLGFWPRGRQVEEEIPACNMRRGLNGAELPGSNVPWCSSQRAPLLQVKESSVEGVAGC